MQTPSPLCSGYLDAPAPDGGRSCTRVLGVSIWGAKHRGASVRACGCDRSLLRSTGGHLGRAGAGLTSSRAEMVEAGVLGTLLREGLRADPGEPSESPSPATSWISRARMATSFTSVWLSLQPAGKKGEPVSAPGSAPARGRLGRGAREDSAFPLPRQMLPPRSGRESLPGGSCWVRGRDRRMQPPTWPKLLPAGHWQCRN